MTANCKRCVVAFDRAAMMTAFSCCNVSVDVRTFQSGDPTRAGA
jgi:hypothetical protein